MGTEYNIDSLTRAQLIAGLNEKSNTDSAFTAPSSKSGYTHVVDIAIDPSRLTTFDSMSELRTWLRQPANSNITVGSSNDGFLRDQIITGLKSSLRGKKLDIDDGLFFEIVDV